MGLICSRRLHSSSRLSINYKHCLKKRMRNGLDSGSSKTDYYYLQKGAHFNIIIDSRDTWIKYLVWSVADTAPTLTGGLKEMSR